MFSAVFARYGPEPWVARPISGVFVKSANRRHATLLAGSCHWAALILPNQDPMARANYKNVLFRHLTPEHYIPIVAKICAAPGRLAFSLLVPPSETPHRQLHNSAHRTDRVSLKPHGRCTKGSESQKTHAIGQAHFQALWHLHGAEASPYRMYLVSHHEEARANAGDLLLAGLALRLAPALLARRLPPVLYVVHLREAYRPLAVAALRLHDMRAAAALRLQLCGHTHKNTRRARVSC